MDYSNSALLRIKFTPLLKKISSRNMVSKCCIEIVPELANTLNLNKISWKEENDLVEYNIPMTYKIIIKKPDELPHGLENKVYHSCVDLLAAYSMSKTDMGAGDNIKRIKSDNSFVLSSYACDKKCDVMPTKALLANKETSNRCENKSTSIETPNTADVSVNSSIGMDECFQTNSNSYIAFNKSKLRVSKSEETLKAELDKNDNATTTCDLTKQSLTNLSKKISTGSLNAYIEGFNEKYGQRKLSLSPICSVNTWDKCNSNPIYLTNNTTTNTSYSYCKKDTLDKANSYNIEDNASTRNDWNKERNVNFGNNIEANKILRVYETKTNYTIQMIDNTKGGQTSNNAGHPKSRYTTVQDITTSISRITMTSYEIENNLVQKQSHVSLNNIIFKNVNESMNFPNKTKRTSILNPEEVFVAEERIENKNKNNTSIISLIDPNQRRCAVRTPPAIRVARILKFFEEEIFPLNAMLNEIKYKCVGLGLSDLFSDDLRPSSPSSPKSIIYKTVPDYQFNTDDDETNKQKTSTVKSNRVVYTFLFNG